MDLIEQELLQSPTKTEMSFGTWLLALGKNNLLFCRHLTYLYPNRVIHHNRYVPCKCVMHIISLRRVHKLYLWGIYRSSKIPWKPNILCPPGPPCPQPMKITTKKARNKNLRSANLKQNKKNNHKKSPKQRGCEKLHPFPPMPTMAPKLLDPRSLKAMVM